MGAGKVVKWAALVILVTALLMAAQALFLPLLFVAFDAFDKPMSKQQITRAVTEHEDALVRAAQAARELGQSGHRIREDALGRPYLDGSEDRTYIESAEIEAAFAIKGIDSIRVEETAVEFDCGATGFVDEGTYYGFYYSETDDIRGIPCAMQPLEPHQGGWLHQEEGSDDAYYTERITGHFFYYQAHY